MYQQAQSPCPMEGRGLIVHRQAGTSEVTIYAATQSPHEWRAFCARLVGIPENRVRVIMRDTGGGFGQKITVLREDICVMLAVMKVSAPLKWIEDRRENLMSAGQSRHEQATVRLGSTGMAASRRSGSTSSRIAGLSRALASVGVRHSGHDVSGALPRAARHVHYEVHLYQHCRPMRLPRALGLRVLCPRGCVGHCARRMGIDPADLRRRNLLSREDQPYTNPNGMEYDHISPLETFEAALKLLDYDGFRHDQAQARQRGRQLGVGIGNFLLSQRRPERGCTRPRERRSGSSRRGRSTSTWPAVPRATASRRRQSS